LVLPSRGADRSEYPGRHRVGTPMNRTGRGKKSVKCRAPELQFASGKKRSEYLW